MERENIVVDIDGNIMKYNKENPLRVTTLFSGYDSQCLSLDSLKDSIPGFDYELVNWCEIDAFAIKAHYKLAGNSIVVQCMAGIFRNAFSTDEVESMTLF